MKDPSSQQHCFPGVPMQVGHQAGSRAMPPDVNIANPKILVVDDDATTVRVFRKYLWEAGYRNVFSTSNSEQTFDLIAHESPDVVLLDVLMPGVNGLEILSAIQNDRDHDNTPVIILTASTDRDIKLQALQRGATDFLQKPIDPCELIPRVRNALRIKAFSDYYRSHSALSRSLTVAQTDESPRLADHPASRLGGWRPAELRWPIFQRTRIDELKKTATIMIVDDEPINILVIRKLLADEGYEKTLSISNATEAVAAVQREKPDLVLLDIMMPETSGLEILETLRVGEQTANLPVIILTASTAQSIKRQAFDLGATDFLSKPIDAVELLPRVRNALLVKSHQDQLENYATALEQEIVEQIKALEAHAVALEEANEMLRRSRDVAQRAERMKSQFLANMSHEIRTPLTSIIGFSEVILSETEESHMPESHVAHIRSIVENGRHLLDVINDVLDISRIEAGCLNVEISLCSPAEICSEVVRSFHVLAERKGIGVLLHFEGPVPEVIQTDPVYVRRILTNLIGNAMKFTEEGSVQLAVRLVEWQEESAIEFRVTDTGIGIGEEYLPQLFKPFMQGDESVGRRYGGTGLGLTISKHLAERLQGEIMVESELGKGSTFRVILPTGPMEGVKLLDDPLAALARNRQAGSEAQRSACATKLNCRILLAEDSSDNRRLISLILRKAGAEVELAEDGQIAFDKAIEAHKRQEPFDLILMDMEMPVLDGRTATRQLREAGYPGVIVALTAHAMAGQRDKCLEAGCDDYATKPIDRTKLLESIRHYVSPIVQQSGEQQDAGNAEVQTGTDAAAD